MILSFIFSSHANAECPALLSAIIDEDRDVVRLLLEEYNSDPDASLEGCLGYEPYDNLPGNSTLLHAAATYEDLILKSMTRQDSIYDLLVRHGANQEATNENGDTPLDIKSCRMWKDACKRPEETPFIYGYGYRYGHSVQ